jgi:hypothetical protein
MIAHLNMDWSEEDVRFGKKWKVNNTWSFLNKSQGSFKWNHWRYLFSGWCIFIWLWVFVWDWGMLTRMKMIWVESENVVELFFIKNNSIALSFHEWIDLFWFSFENPNCQSWNHFYFWKQRKLRDFLNWGNFLRSNGIDETDFWWWICGFFWFFIIMMKWKWLDGIDFSFELLFILLFMMKIELIHLFVVNEWVFIDSIFTIG